jgi:hypothetical protein
MTAAVDRFQRTCLACGAEFFARQKQIDAGRAKYCGRACACKGINTKHGASVERRHSLEYATWHSMIQRCHNENSRAYGNYGGRGIKVCDEWRRSFEAFFRDMGPRMSAELSIDRIDHNGDYTKENCRWADKQTQQLNRSCTIRITLNGVTATISEWAKETGLTEKLIRSRYEKRWSPEQIITHRKHAKPSLRKAAVCSTL